ncbi:MAG TPA: alkaline phosphatase family protein [Candidatus Cybelea sp.]|nr:alkaline phosphatase family protein [Candidatus Cybelea sp.]
MPAASAGAKTPIGHVIVIVQDGRSFDNLFYRYPGADWVKKGETHTHKLVRLKPITLETSGYLGLGTVLPDDYRAFRKEWNHGAMDGFDLVRFGADGSGEPAGDYPYAYVERSESKPYWDLAGRYALADRLFSTEQAGGYTANLVLIAGSTLLRRPGLFVTGATNVGGCDAPAGTHSILNGKKKGPPPCFAFRTMADLLDKKHVSWKYYTELCSGKSGDIGCTWDAFESIKAVRYGSDWKRNVSVPSSNILRDLRGADFPAVSWVTPTLANSDDAVSGSKTGPAWVMSIVDAVRASKYWNRTAIVVVWGDWGGFYDNFPPPLEGKLSLSMRVPMMVVSPYAKSGYISHTPYELASILKFMEYNWNLGSLDTTDRRATNIIDMFDFGRPAGP